MSKKDERTGADLREPKPAKPFLRWAGSKRAMLQHLRRNVPARFNKYIEPFAGSACLFFDLAPAEAVLGDLNEHLIATYKTVVSKPAAVAKTLAALPTGSEAFYRIRSDFARQKGAIPRAATFIYLNRFCFNGLYRTNRDGHFNVPYGAPRSAAVPTADDLRSAAAAMKKAVLRSGDFEAIVLESASRGDFVYLDPPFHTTTTRTFTQYNAKPFAEDDFERLLSLVEVLDKRGCKFLISYAHSSEAVAAFSGYRISDIITRRNISGFPQHRGSVRELIVTNYDSRES